MSKLTIATINRIIANRIIYRRDTIIGRYTYHFDANTGDVLRCLTRDVGQTWFAPDGALCDGWQVVCQLPAACRL
ncbi:MAG: hypothetical protein LUG45_05230 [Clostridiales bacterium]|nr:hypothetical protein [Clostridiales bacterium]